jgi:hypothetical protein
MTTIEIYNNAIIGKGHSTPYICSEISYGFYHLTNLIKYKGYDIKYYAETSSGLSYIFFEQNDDIEVIINAYYDSLVEWDKAYYPNGEVEIIRIKEFKRSD